MRLILKILAAPLVVALTLFVWICTIFLYCTGMVLGLAALVVAFLGVAVLVTYSLQNGIILLVIIVLLNGGIPGLDHESESVALSVGIDGGAASAEEAAMHVIEDPDDEEQ